MRSEVMLTPAPARRAAGLGLMALLLCAPPALAQGTWTKYLNPTNVYDVALDGDGIWVAANGGAVRYPRGNNGTPVIYNRTANGLASDHLTAVDATPDGNVWFGTSDRGISRWNRPEQYWETIDLNFGLPSNTITRIVDDGRFLWVGTPSGFATLAGDTVVQTCTSLQDSCLPNLYVNDIFIGQKTHGVGPYYFATKSGVAAFDGLNWVNLNGGAMPSGAGVQALAQLDTVLYAATNKQLFMYGGTGWTLLVTLAPSTGQSDSDAFRSLVASSGKLYAGRTQGTSVFSNGALSPITNRAGEELRVSVRRVAVQNDTVYSGTSSGILRYGAPDWFDLNSLFKLDVPAYNSIQNVSLEPGSGGKLWFTIQSNDAAVKLDRSQPAGKQWGVISSPPLEPVQTIPLLADADGFKWFGHCCLGVGGTADLLGGVDLVDDRGSSVLRRHYVKPPHNVLAIGEAPDRKKYFGTGNDLDSMWIFVPRRDDALAAALGQASGDSVWLGLSTRTPGFPLPGPIQTVFGFHGTDIWIGTLSSGISVWHAGQCRDASCWTHFVQGDPVHKLAGVRVQGIAFTGDSVWVGTEQGLSVLDASQDAWIADETVVPDGPLPGNTVRALATGPNGDLWVGTDGGLALLRGGHFQSYTTDNSQIVSNDIYALAVDATKTPYELWVGTSFGISRLQVDLSGGGGGGCSNCPPASPTPRFYPHPFRPGVGQTLHLNGSFTTGASVRIFDAKGRVVREFTGVGVNQAFWDGRDTSGNLVGSGLYRVRVEADGVVHRMLLAVIR